MGKDWNKRGIYQEYLSISDLEIYSGISRRTLWDLVYNPINPIPHFRIGAAGRLVRVKRQDFDQWIKGYKADNIKVDIDDIVNEILN
ncbi:helix-turn-helix domain-containing protein [Desulfobacterales bacterium HSG17]|nr:helix-turn-helix domain-containing protein [Desulfobacterales bacterium HSG17]